MRLAVIGSRSFKDRQRLFKVLDEQDKINMIISGGAIGADLLAEEYADQKRIRKVILKPDYEKHGRSAPLVRNRYIIDLADTVIAFWDGKSAGTANSLTHARKKGIKIIIHQFKPS